MTGTESSATEGYVEAFDELKRQWGHVCDNSFDIIDAHVVCKMLGFHTAIVALSNSDSEDSFGTAPSGSSFILDNLDCSEAENSVFDCSIADEPPKECEIAGVKCAEGKLGPIYKKK